MKPSTIKEILPELRAMRRPPFVWGPSGAGKSSVIAQHCAEQGLMLRDMRLSQLDAIDFRFPLVDVKAKKLDWLPNADLPTQNDPPGWLFLDECNGAMPAVASVAYQLILDHRIGSYVLPDHWSIIAAGNNTSDRGVTHQMPAPLNNRFIHIDFEIDADDWHRQAMQDGVHTLIRSYLRLKGRAALHTFDSARNPRSFATPRTWYFADQILKRGLKPAVQHELLQGALGEGAAAELTGFIRDAAAMPDIDSILMNPTKAKMPGNQSVMHAVVTTLLDDKLTVGNFDQIMGYITRLPEELQMVFVRGAIDKTKDAVCNTAAYMDWGIKNQAFIR